MPTPETEYAKERRQARERVAALKYTSAHPGRRTQNTYRWRAKHPETFALHQRISQLRKKYGITLEQYDAIFVSQGSACAICRRSENPGKKRWHVDHCHLTNVVRGILCHYCNLMLGQAQDDVVRLRAAIAYLEKHSA